MKGKPNANNINYSAIRKAIYRCVKPLHHHTKPIFSIDLDKLNELVAQYNLVVIPGDRKSRSLGLYDVPLIEDYFFGEQLVWFNENRQLMQVIFMDERCLDEETAYAIEMLKNPEHPDDPDFDPINALAKILHDKRCWKAQVAGYMSNDPTIIEKMDGVGVFIAIKANKVVLNQDSYEYDQEDI